jgi:hypothetical protein
MVREGWSGGKSGIYPLFEFQEGKPILKKKKKGIIPNVQNLKLFERLKNNLMLLS